jgi:glycosyltransferase involved in cell wall biosynthesis
MVRILHLLPAELDYQTDSAVEQLFRTGGRNFSNDLRTIGPGGDFANTTRAVLALWRHGAGADLIHAWGESALIAAAMAGTQSIVYSPTAFPRRREIGRLRAIMEYRPVDVVCPTDTMRRAMVENGVPIEHCHLIRPGVNFSRVSGRTGGRADSALRAALGFAPEDHVVLAVGESNRPADHPRTAWTAAVLHVLEDRNKLLLWGRGPIGDRTVRFVEALRLKEVCRVATERLGENVSFEQLLPAADVAIVTPSSPCHTLPIAICMAAGVPIVGMATPTVCELLEDRHNALLVTGKSPRVLAQRVLDLRGDADLRWKICDRARAEAYDFFSQTRFVKEFGELYIKCLGASVVSDTNHPRVQLGNSRTGVE